MTRCMGEDSASGRSSLMVPGILYDLTRSLEAESKQKFPPTEIYNETWMLRLVLEAFRTTDIADHPLAFLPESDWYSEARLGSRFRPTHKGDTLGEGVTHADGVIGNFSIRADTSAGLELPESTKQFVVVEAKMASNLSVGTTRVAKFNQATRNISCMAHSICDAGLKVDDIANVGFVVLAPQVKIDNEASNLQAAMLPESIRGELDARIELYRSDERDVEHKSHLEWKESHFSPLLERMREEGRVAVISWENCLMELRKAQFQQIEDLQNFYDRCLELNFRSDAANA